MTLEITQSPVYYGEEQHFNGSFNPVNREALWVTNYNEATPLADLIRSLNRLRSHAASNGTRYTERQSNNNNNDNNNDYLTYPSSVVYNTTHTLALRKGYPGNQVITVLSNLGSYPNNNPEKTLTLPARETGFHPRQNITEIISCRSVLTDSALGDLSLSLDDGGPRVYYPTNSLASSGLCGYQRLSSLRKRSEGSSFILKRGELGSLMSGLVTACAMM